MLNKERLDELLDYSPDSGLFTWKVNRRGKAKSGCIAGSKNGQGYIIIKIDGKFYFAHRLAWLVTHGTFPVNMIDHIDGNRENNKINNLREATDEQNMWNSAAGKNNKTGVKGVSWDGRRKRFRASISIKGKNKEIGSYLSLKDAESAIKDYRLKLHGKFANNEVINNNLLEGKP
ncbi:TPA: hypothetical protein MJA66_14730 [Klebsiella pneumoniae]|nr:hypothetical protein [Klebsiella pneumoniae]